MAQANLLKTLAKTVKKLPDNNTNGKVVNNQGQTNNVKQTTTNNSQPVIQNATTGQSATINSASKGSIMGDDFYHQEKHQYSAKEAANLANGSSIFSRYSKGKIGTDGENISGLNCVAQGGRYKVTMDTDGDGTMEEVTAAEAMAASFDSELDLYIEDSVMQVVQKYGHKFYTGDGFLSDEALKELEAKGIKVDKINNRTYTFSLVDEEGNILEDANGNKGSILFGDWVIPDGYAQGAELNLSSMLDLMGYDCVSKADFIGKEGDYDRVLAEVEAGLQNGEYASSDKKVTDIYGEVKSSWSRGFGKGSTAGSKSNVVDDMIWAAENTTNFLKDGVKFTKEKMLEIKEAFDKLLEAKLSENTNPEEKETIENETAQQVANNFGIEAKQVLEMV